MPEDAKAEWIAHEAKVNIDEAKEYHDAGIFVTGPDSEYGDRVHINAELLVKDRLARGIYTQSDAERISAVIREVGPQTVCVHGVNVQHPVKWPPKDA
jgi:hypothetical protein